MAEDTGTGKSTEETHVTADLSTAGKAGAAAGATEPATEETATGETAARPAGIGTGPGRLLLWLYGIFTVAALSRSIVQISMKFQHAPLAYTLSLVAGVVYAVILVALSKGGESARRVALVLCSVELAGVIAVGTLTVVDSSAFADSTVWSYYGVDYLLLPLALPVSGLLWLRRAGRATAAGDGQATATAAGETRS
jgi:hypothetical protein